MQKQTNKQTNLPSKQEALSSILSAAQKKKQAVIISPQLSKYECERTG
jgi:hypothetical protein